MEALRPWNEFKREAQANVVGTSNRYLRTEYDTIVASAQNEPFMARNTKR